MAVTSLILGSGLTNIYGNFASNPSDPADALIAAKQQQYNVGAIQVRCSLRINCSAPVLARIDTNYAILIMRVGRCSSPPSGCIHSRMLLHG